MQCIVKLSKALSFKQQIETADSTLRHYVTQGWMNGMELCPIIDGLEIDGNDEEDIISNDKINEYNDVDGNANDEMNDGVADGGDYDYDDTDGIIQDESEELIQSPSNEYKNDDEIIYQDTSTTINEQINEENFDNNLITITNNTIDEQSSLPTPLPLTEPIKEEIPLQIDNTNVDDKKQKIKIEKKTTVRQRFSKRKIAQKLNAIDNDKNVNEESIKNSVMNENGYLNPTKWMCFECKKEFSDLRKLNRHKKIHAEDKPYPCVVCSKSFIERTDLTRHLMRHYRTGTESNGSISKFKCLDCHAGFNVEKDLKIHSSIHRKDGKITCYGCDKDFLSKFLFLCKFIRFCFATFFSLCLYSKYSIKTTCTYTF